METLMQVASGLASGRRLAQMSFRESCSSPATVIMAGPGWWPRKQRGSDVWETFGVNHITLGLRKEVQK